MRSLISKPCSLRRSLSARLSSRACALGAEVVVEGEVERDRVRAVLREREVLVLLGADLDVAGFEAHRRSPSTSSVNAPVVVERAPHLGAVDLFEQLLDTRRLLAEPRSERAEVRHDAVRQQPFE